MDDEPIAAYEFDGKGGARALSAEEVLSTSGNWQNLPEILHWVLVDYSDPTAVEWLRSSSGLDPVLVSALTATDPRPRSLVQGEGMLLVLRGVNTNAGQDPEDMVALRIWIEPGLIVTVRHRQLASIRDLRDALDAGRGPGDIGDFLVGVIDKMLDRIGAVVLELDDMADDLEDQVISVESRELRTQLGALRRQAIALRRYVAPQRDTIGRLYAERVPWLSDMDRARLQEAADRIQRYVEDLDSARDRAAVTQEELSNRLAESTNRTMYTLSVVAAIFLPLGLITGLLGINVGGLPGVESPYAFWAVTTGLVVMAWALAAWFRKQNLI